jgi:hypothetical protein
VTLGGRRVEVKRPRVRSAGVVSEVGLSTYEHFADRDPLGRVVLERMLAGVSARRIGARRSRSASRSRSGRAVDVQVGGVKVVRGAHS